MKTVLNIYGTISGPSGSFTDLDDVQTQVLKWLQNTANRRVHQTTRDQPVNRLVQDALRPVPDPLPDFRETEILKVYKNFGIRFDSNVYTVSPRMVGKSVTFKADKRTVSIYSKEKQVAAHTRYRKKSSVSNLNPTKSRSESLRKKS